VENFMFLRSDKRNGKINFHVWGYSWAIWLNRNALMFISKIILTPNALIYKCVSFLQHWVIAVAGPDKEDMGKLAGALT
jgi:hypothetical protein